MSEDYRMDLAIKLFNMNMKQNNTQKNHEIIDALEYAAQEAKVNIFKLSKELKLDFYHKQKLKKDKK